MSLPASRKHARTVATALTSAASLLGASLAFAACTGSGCNEAALAPAPDAGASTFGLTAEQAAREVAKVGDRTITLGEFAQALDRMDQFDRLRYQTKERRRELLNELIDVELLAAEAKRRGLDKKPEVVAAERQILRDAMIARARLGLPAAGDIPAEEVRAYYEKHAAKFAEPERRRVAAIATATRAEAERALERAREIKSPAEWGELVQAHSLYAPKQKPAGAAVELAGDLGIVGPPSDERGASIKVPEPLRAAVFKIGKVGEILPEVVEAEGKFFVVRLSGMTGAHTRSLAEADRSIRVAILQDKLAAAEKKLEDELRKKIPIQIDEAALSAIDVPGVAAPESTGQPAAPASAGAGDGAR